MKTKLTLYVDEEISKRAKTISRIRGISISKMFTDMVNRQDIRNDDIRISEKVNRWIGIAESAKDYKSLREEIIKEKQKRYEDLR